MNERPLTTRQLAERVESLERERDRLREALKPFANIADTWTIQTAAMCDELLTVSNGQRLCGIKAQLFIEAYVALNGKPPYAL